MNDIHKKITAIAVDDEPKALEIIERYCQQIGFLVLKESFRDPLKAVEWLHKHPTDLLFLDINMPNLSGLKFRQLIGEQPMIIFTTAYSEFAVKSYELNALDYLLKPIQFERFFEAVLKAKGQTKNEKSTTNPIDKNTSNTFASFIYVKSGNKHFKINTAEIQYLQKEGNYIFFHTKEKKIMSRLNVQQALDILPQDKFMRIHKSYIVGLQHIEIIEPHQVIIRTSKIPVAKPYREELLSKLKSI